MAETKLEAWQLADTTITRRDYFAAHAPAEIPDWFEGPTAPRPTAPERPKEIAAAIRHWLDDPCQDLSGYVGGGTLHIAMADEFEREWGEYMQAIDRARTEDKIARYFAWRVFYANRMIEAMGNQSPECPF